ncbi:hypothetical protein [Kitasatospora camelliae]|uniref:Lipoprotein n=1 Tax=Kitasatospora camelliae TaxID=3156397 RepID=A0AAU8JU08_9ACTN
MWWSPRAGLRFLVAVLAACAALPVLAACTPVPKRAVAVRMERGNLVIDPGRCRSEVVTDVSISTRVDGRLDTWVAIPRSMAAVVDTIDPAALGPDWAADGTRPTALQPGATYRIGVSVSRDGRLDSGSVEVDGATLLGLADDQAVVGRGPSAPGVVTPRAEYRSAVEARCE